MPGARVKGRQLCTYWQHLVNGKVLSTVAKDGHIGLQQLLQRTKAGDDGTVTLAAELGCRSRERPFAATLYILPSIRSSWECLCTRAGAGVPPPLPTPALFDEACFALIGRRWARGWPRVHVVGSLRIC